MTEEKNEALNRWFVEEVFDQGHLDALDELLDPGDVDRAAPPGFPTGREGTKRFTAMERGRGTLEGRREHVTWGRGQEMQAGYSLALLTKLS